MKTLLILLSHLLIVKSTKAQWFWQPLPLHKDDFTMVAAKNYTAAFEYELVENEKMLKRVVEFGRQGLPAVLLEKGTNDNGDSMNITEVVYKFDANGRLTRETTTDRSEGSEWSSVYTYGNGVNPTKRVTISIDPATTVYTYNPQGRLTKTYTTVRMAAIDKEGNPTKKRIDKPQERAVYVYNEKGKLKEMVVYNLAYPEEAGKWSFKLAVTYDPNGEVIKIERQRGDGTIYHTEKFSYNTDGLLVGAATKREDEAEQRFVYEYCITCVQSWKK